MMSDGPYRRAIIDNLSKSVTLSENNVKYVKPPPGCGDPKQLTSLPISKSVPGFKKSSDRANILST